MYQITKLILIIIFLLLLQLSCGNYKKISEGDVFIDYYNDAFAKAIFYSDDSLKIEARQGLLYFEELGMWYIIKDTLFFYQPPLEKQESAFTLIKQSTDNKLDSTTIKIIREDSAVYLALIKVNNDTINYYYSFVDENLFIPVVDVKEITMSSYRCPVETFNVSGNIFEFRYNNPKLIYERRNVPKKYLIKKNKLIPIKENGELDYYHAHKKIKK